MKMVGEVYVILKYSLFCSMLSFLILILCVFLYDFYFSSYEKVCFGKQEVEMWALIILVTCSVSTVIIRSLLMMFLGFLDRIEKVLDQEGGDV